MTIELSLCKRYLSAAAENAINTVGFYSRLPLLIILMWLSSSKLWMWIKYIQYVVRIYKRMSSDNSSSVKKINDDNPPIHSWINTRLVHAHDVIQRMFHRSCSCGIHFERWKGVYTTSSLTSVQKLAVQYPRIDLIIYSWDERDQCNQTLDCDWPSVSSFPQYHVNRYNWTCVLHANVTRCPSLFHICLS